jgi:putative cardiolipin synthase
MQCAAFRIAAPLSIKGGGSMRKRIQGLIICILSVVWLLISCADLSHKRSYIDDVEFSTDFITMIYDQRTWTPPGKLDFDPIGYASKAVIPINEARTKIIGPAYDDSLNSLAAKIWMIENAEHTIDIVYYIFKRDIAGYSLLGAMCDAVKRGVDVRIMVDSIGSLHATHNELRALETCADEAGYIKDEHGRPTDKQARVQVVIINALSKWSSRKNRRSHDKILVVDGHLREKAIVMTGGRNVSVSYYGIHEDGSPDPLAYQDLEIVLRPNLEVKNELETVGDISTYYFSALFLHRGNKRLYPVPDEINQGVYAQEREKAQESLAFVKSLPGISAKLKAMPAFLTKDYRVSQVRLAHELANLTNPNAMTEVGQNLKNNPNSIQTILYEYLRSADSQTLTNLVIVSPYFFVARYYDEDGNELYDGVKEIYKYLENNPESTFEIITNSVLTSDNFMTQAVIDMDTAPRLLLSPELLARWLSDADDGEFNPELVESEEWKRMINNPRIKIYQTGKVDSKLVGGDQDYGKLHAKFFIANGIGFVGTTNFDYRSRVLQSELGFYFKGQALYDDLNNIITDLKSKSHLWGTPEWLEMRKLLVSRDSSKASTTRKQRGIFKTIRNTGLEWLF